MAVKEALSTGVFDDENVVLEGQTYFVETGAAFGSPGRTMVDDTHGGFGMATPGIDEQCLTAHLGHSSLWQAEGKLKARLLR